MPNTVTVDYIFEHYAGLMTLPENWVMRKAIIASRQNQSITEVEFGNNPEVKLLIKDGYEQFRINTAERILKDHAGQIYFHYCPACGKPPRTTSAKQCRFCNYKWHGIVLTTFEVKTISHVTDQGYYIWGELLSGNAKAGMKLHLTSMGLSYNPVIKEIGVDPENATKSQAIGLFLGELTLNDVNHIKFHTPFSHPIFITE